MTLIVVSKLEQLPHQTVTQSDIIISREGKVLKHRNSRPIDLDPPQGEARPATAWSEAVTAFEQYQSGVRASDRMHCEADLFWRTDRCVRCGHSIEAYDIPFCEPCDKADEQEWERIAGLIKEVSA